MEEIIKHINDTNASYRDINAGDAKNTDLFLDNDSYSFFGGTNADIEVRLHKDNLSQAVLFIASILPRKYDNSNRHFKVEFSSKFVFDNLLLLDAVFRKNGSPVTSIILKWRVRKNVPKSNGQLDTRLYLINLISDVVYTNSDGQVVNTKFTIRNYLAGNYSDIHFKKNDDNIYDCYITNALTPHDDGKDVLVGAISIYSQPLQQIYYGAPGTGKSHGIKEFFIKNKISNDNIFRTTFHPDSDYSTFVGAYKPTMNKCYRYEANQRVNYPENDDFAQAKKNDPIVDAVVGYSFIPQTFLQAYIQAYKTDENVYLLIEEINRGNCAQIFGDLFQLLDRNEEGYSDYTIKADADLRKYLEEELGKESDGIKGGELCLPPNLHIWATMNTSDQSLFPIDSAFKRRWEWKYIKISDAGKGWQIDINGTYYDWYKFIEQINKVISNMTSSADKQLGYFFCKAGKKVNETDADPTIITAETFVGKVLFYLWNDVFKDYGFDNSELFKYNKIYDGKSVVRDLTFPDFYDDNNEVDVDTVKQFVDNILKWNSNENK